MNLTQFWQANPKAAIAFSGGVDSAYLLYSAVQSGADVKAYYAKTAFQPAFELEDAKKLAAQLGAQMEILTLDVLSVPKVVENPQNRCYYCKNALFSAISAALTAAAVRNSEYFILSTIYIFALGLSFSSISFFTIHAVVY